MTRSSALLALHAAVLLFGFAGLFGRWLDLAPSVIVLGRTVVAAAVLGVVRLRGGGRSPLDPALAVNGAILALHWVSFFAAIQAAGVAIGLLGFSSFPLFTLVLERWLLGRRWHGADPLTAIVVAGGLALLVPPEPSLADRTVQGLAWGIVSGLTFALLAVRNRGLAADRAATDLAFGQNLWAAAFVLPFAWSGAPSAIGGRDIALLLVLGIGCTALAHTLFIAALAGVAAHTAATVAALEPVYGIALAALLLGETPGPRTLAGGVLIVGAAIAASRRAGDPASIGSAPPNR